MIIYYITCVYIYVYVYILIEESWAAIHDA